MEGQHSRRDRLRAALVVVLSATFIAFIYAARNVIGTLSSDRPFDWGWTVGYEFLYWYIWAAFTPLILWFAGRLDPERTGRRRLVLALVGFGLLVAPLQAIIENGLALLSELLRRVPLSEISRRIERMPRSIVFETFSNFIVYLLIAGGHYAYVYYRMFREREVRSLELEGRLVQAELQSLKMQLQPHFLFNTLNTISVLMMRDATAANQMLVRLSDLLRLSLDHGGVQEVSLKEELEFLGGYLEIEQTRFQDRLTVNQDIDPATLSALVPNLILQPLVENAIHHGISRKLGMGRLDIRARLEGSDLRLEVQDNGPGLVGDAVIEKGIGLVNTRARLQQLYGTRQQFRIENASPGGVMVSITIPFRKSGDDG